jgi:Family of unknown function (DUF5343)
MTIESGRAGRHTYPYLPDRNWWALRRRFQQTPPRGEVDASYLASVLGIGEAAAGNLIAPLRAVGLVDDSGRPTDRAMAWRDDDGYRQATEEMLESVYPQGLRDAAPPPDPDRDTVIRWFLRDTGTGQSAAERMARFYILLAAGDPSGAEQVASERTARQVQSGSPGRQGRHPRARRASTTDGAAAPLVASAGGDRASSLAVPRQPHQPSIHIDIQVHIDPAATSDQIDQIFASMARHLYGRD